QIDDDLLDERTGNALLEPYARRLEIPNPVQVLGQGSQHRWVRRSGCWMPGSLFLETFLQPARLLQGSIPARLKLPRDQPVLRIHRVVLPLGPSYFVSCRFELHPQRLEFALPLLTKLLGSSGRGIDCGRGEDSYELARYGSVDGRSAEGDA